jgi:hypothetical protein
MNSACATIMDTSAANTYSAITRSMQWEYVDTADTDALHMFGGFVGC